MAEATPSGARIGASASNSLGSCPGRRRRMPRQCRRCPGSPNRIGSPRGCPTGSGNVRAGGAAIEGEGAVIVTPRKSESRLRAQTARIPAELQSVAPPDPGEVVVPLIIVRKREAGLIVAEIRGRPAEIESRNAVKRKRRQVLQSEGPGDRFPIEPISRGAVVVADAETKFVQYGRGDRIVVRDHHASAVVVGGARRQHEGNWRRRVLVLPTQPPEERLLASQNLVDTGVGLPGGGRVRGVRPVVGGLLNRGGTEVGQWVKRQHLLGYRIKL